MNWDKHKYDRALLMSYMHFTFPLPPPSWP